MSSEFITQNIRHFLAQYKFDDKDLKEIVTGLSGVISRFFFAKGLCKNNISF